MAGVVTVVGAQLTVVAVPFQLYELTGSSAWVGLTGVFGLDQRRVAGRLTPSGALQGKAGATRNPLRPEELERRYSFPKGRGDGQTIAIAESSTGGLISGNDGRARLTPPGR